MERGGDDSAVQMTSEDPIRGDGQTKGSFYAKVYQHWLAQRGAGVDERSEAEVSGRWKKLQPEVTKFEGIFSKLKSKERSGWNEEMFVKSAVSIYGERHKQPFEFLDAWNELRDKPKWIQRLTASSTTLGTQRKKEAVPRPEGQKAAKAAKIEVSAMMVCQPICIYDLWQRRKRRL
ncbi:hypothetical protein DVH05_025602 [Phytophthora capsici]|nr:hypothetical protein DVH05_025602 [Phytophthora capsici]